MRFYLGILAFAVALGVAAQGQYELPAPLAPPPPSIQLAGGMMGFSVTGPGGGQLITLIDSNQKVMSVYHIDSQTGQITLRSVRRLIFDFAIEEFNATEPLPADIRQMLGRKSSN